MGDFSLPYSLDPIFLPFPTFPHYFSPLLVLPVRTAVFEHAPSPPATPDYYPASPNSANGVLRSPCSALHLHKDYRAATKPSMLAI